MLRRVVRTAQNFLTRFDLKQWLIYAVVFFAFFFVVLYLTFPFDAVRSLIVTGIEAKTGTKVTLDSLEPLRMTGMEVHGLKMAPPSDPARVMADIDLARFRMHVLPLLRGRLVLDYDLVAYGGGFSGVMEARSGGRWAMAMNFKDLDLTKYNFAKLIEDYGTMKLEGGLSGHLGLYLEKSNKRNNQGQLDLAVEGMKISEAKVLGREIPEVHFKPSSVRLDFRSTGFSINEWEMEADNLAVSMTGRLTVRDEFKKSRLSLTLKAKPSDKLMDKFQELAFLSAPDKDGWYKISINGPLNKPKVTAR